MKLVFSWPRSLVLTMIVLVTGAALVFVVVLVFNSNDKSPQRMSNKASSVDWRQVNSMTQYNIALNAEGDAANKPVSGQIQIGIDLEQVDDLPQALEVFKIVPLVRSDDEFRQIASRFGLIGRCEPNGLRMAEGSRGISYDPENDKITYRDGQVDEFPSHKPRVPPEQECKQIAMDFAAERGLLTEGAKVVATSEEVGGSPTWGTDHAAAINRTVIIGVDLTLGGYPVRGTGMQLRIVVCDDGQIGWVSDTLRRLESYGWFRVKPVQQALEEAEAGIDSVNLQWTVPNPTINEVGIFYYSDSSNRSHGLVIPVYAFMGPDCCIYVPAVMP